MRALAAVLAGAVLLAAPVQAQAPAAPPAKPPARAPAAKAPEYDPRAEVTLTGVVEDFHESKVRTDHPGLHLIVRTETETVEVHACPVRFMRELEFALDKGDTVTVVGSRPGAGEVLVAREITKGQTRLILRDEDGTPVWTGR